MPINMFFSSSIEDRRPVNKIILNLLQKEGLIEKWSAQEIPAGSDWKGEVDNNLNEAELILLMVSPDFLNSDYPYCTEILRAIERHERGEARVIPIILRPVYWQRTPFAKLQVLPADGKPLITWQDQEEVVADITRSIIEVIEVIITQKSAVIVVDTLLREVWVNAHKIQLRGEQFRLLEYLARHSGSICTKKEMLHFLYGHEYTSRQADLVDRNLRALLSVLGDNYITYIHEQGFILRGKVIVWDAKLKRQVVSGSPEDDFQENS